MAGIGVKHDTIDRLSPGSLRQAQGRLSVLSPESPRRVRTASIATLGCKLNQAESYRIQCELAAAGVDLLPFGDPADLSIVNTCTVTHVADQQARQLLRRASRVSPDGLVVAVGCYAQIAPHEVRAVEGVDLVVTSDKERLVAQLEASGLLLGDDPARQPAGPAGPDHRVPLPATRVRQFVKVQDGCDDYCTYCIVPFARGHSLSRAPDDIVGEVQTLIGRGCREVVLTGVQIGAYGRDRYRLKGADLPPPGAPLAQLVRQLLDETAVERIRISSIQPQDWPDDFLDLFADSRLCRHLHLPLQAGCDATLRRMSRRYTTADFARLVERVRGDVPDVAITADMIVGFPGETEADHAASVAFAEAIGFAGVHVFRYSPRRGTAASRMGQQVPPEVKKSRAEELRAAVEEMAERYRGRFLGRTLPVLWEEEVHPPPQPSPSREEGVPETPSPSTGQGGGGADPSPLWTGLTDNYLRVNIISRAELLGKSTHVVLAELDGDTFQGREVARV